MGVRSSTLTPEEIINRGRAFDHALLNRVKEIRDSDLPFYSHGDSQRDANEPEKDCYIGIDIERGHGYFFVGCEGNNVEDYILKYHIVLGRDGNFYLARQTVKIEDFVRDVLVDGHTFHEIGRTKLSIYQLDLLANYVIFDSYQLIRQDCLEYAKQFGKQIAMNENYKSEVEYQQMTGHLGVMGDGSSGQSEAKSRRHPNKPIALGIGLYGHAKNKDGRIQLVLGTVLVTCLSLKVLEYVAGKLWWNG